jgi:hypothetical protein
MTAGPRSKESYLVTCDVCVTFSSLLLRQEEKRLLLGVIVVASVVQADRVAVCKGDASP